MDWTLFKKTVREVDGLRLDMSTFRFKSKFSFSEFWMFLTVVSWFSRLAFSWLEI